MITDHGLSTVFRGLKYLQPCGDERTGPPAGGPFRPDRVGRGRQIEAANRGFLC